MPRQTANIREFSRATPPGQALWRQIRTLLIAMSALTMAVAAAAFFFAGPKAMLAALGGGSSQIVAVLAYGWIVRSKGIPAPRDMLFKHFLGEIVKIMLALALMVVGFYLSGANAAWFIGAFTAALAAYWLVLILK